MFKTTFYVKDMDCPSEEQLIRMKLSEFNSIKQLKFNLKDRNILVFHEDDLEQIQSSINSLGLGEKIIETIEYDGNLLNENDLTDKKLLWSVLIINFIFFIIEIVFGLIANSMGLVADSLDMLSDSFVYGMSIYAISGTLKVKKRIALLSGVLQLLLAIIGFSEVIRRFFGFEEVPNFYIMISISILALIANSASLIILNKSQSKEVHIQSSQIFTSNDVIANTGVIIAGILVLTLNSKIPDLIVGSLVFLLVLKGAIKIIKLSR